MIDLSVVIPAFNEESRLPMTLRELQKLVYARALQVNVTEVIVIDDGSSDATKEVVESLRAEWSLLHLISAKINKGKGAAVHQGIARAKSSWILVADADMSTPWTELPKLISLIKEQHLIMGSRGLSESQIEIRQHWLRQTMGKIFNWILRKTVRLPFKDTQCGFKLIRNDVFFRSNILPRLQVQRFSWDVELILWLLRFQKIVQEFPVRWRHQDQSRVRMFRDSIEMLVAVWLLKRRLKKNIIF